MKQHVYSFLDIVEAGAMALHEAGDKGAWEPFGFKDDYRRVASLVLEGALSAAVGSEDGRMMELRVEIAKACRPSGTRDVQTLLDMLFSCRMWLLIGWLHVQELKKKIA